LQDYYLKQCNQKYSHVLFIVAVFAFASMYTGEGAEEMVEDA
jgi:hypothetical protein